MNLRLTLTIATLGLALTQVPAQAGSAMLSCFGGRGVGTCVLNYGGGDGNPHVRTIPAPATEQDKAGARSASGCGSHAASRRWRSMISACSVTPTRHPPAISASISNKYQ